MTSTTRETARCLVCEGSDHEVVMRTPPQMHMETEADYTFVRCASCDLVYLNPRVPSAEIGAYYGPEYLPYRGEEAWGRYRNLAARAQRGTDRKRVRVVRKAYPVRTDTRVLDIGCGRPSFLRQLRQTAGCAVAGVDFQDEGWKEGEASEWEDIDLNVGGVASLDDAARYEVFTLWHYIEHDYEPLETLRRLRELASSGARLVVEVPDYDGLTRKWQERFWAGYHTPRHLAVYTPKTLRELLRRAGWDVVTAHSYGTLDPYVLWWMGRLEVRDVDWKASMEDYLPGLLAGQLFTLPLFALQRWLSLGVQTAIARPA